VDRQKLFSDSTKDAKDEGRRKRVAKGTKGEFHKLIAIYVFSVDANKGVRDDFAANSGNYTKSVLGGMLLFFCLSAHAHQPLLGCERSIDYSTCRCGPLLRMAYMSLKFLTLSLSPANATPSHVSSEGPGGAVVPVSLAPVVGSASRSGPVPVLSPSGLEPGTEPVPESFRNQGPRTRTAKNRKKPQKTGPNRLRPVL
jgi:hypothetical protein